MSTQPNTALAQRVAPDAREGIQLEIGVFPGDKEGETVKTLVKFTPKGTIKAMMTRVPLSEKNGEIWFMAGYVGQGNDKHWEPKAKAGITALGYDKLNNFAGVIIHQPETILMDDGQVRPNPYFGYDGKQLVFVKIRLMGLGRNAVGNIILHDRTVRFDLCNYLARDAWSKWTGKKSANQPQAWGQAYRLGAVPQEVQDDAQKVLIECAAGVVLALDLTCKDVINFLGEHLQRGNFAERIATTICRRNLYKAFFGVVAPRETHGPTGLVSYWAPVVSWPQADRDFGTVRDLVEQAKSGEIQIDGHVATVVTETDDVEVEDVEAELVGEASEIDATDDTEPDAPTPVDVSVATPSAERRPAEDNPMATLQASVLRQYRELAGISDAGRQDALAILAQHNLGGAAEINRCGDEAKLRAVARDIAQGKAHLASRSAKQESTKKEGDLF